MPKAHLGDTRRGAVNMQAEKTTTHSAYYPVAWNDNRTPDGVDGCSCDNSDGGWHCEQGCCRCGHCHRTRTLPTTPAPHACCWHLPETCPTRQAAHPNLKASLWERSANKRRASAHSSTCSRLWWECVSRRRCLQLRQRL